MEYSNGKVAGVLFFIAATKFVQGIIVAEALYPGYSLSKSEISYLGIGPYAIVFNGSIFLLGLLMIVGTYFLQRAFNVKILTVLLTLTVLGFIGVSIFTQQLFDSFYRCSICLPVQRTISYLFL